MAICAVDVLFYGFNSQGWENVSLGVYAKIGKVVIEDMVGWDGG